MANMILAFRVMPEDGEVEYQALEAAVKDTVENYHESVQVRSINEEPVGFGLKAVACEIQIDEVCGCEDLEEKLAALTEVGEVTITKMDRL